MYLFKQDTLRDKGINAKKIDQWRQILNEYEQNFKRNYNSKKKRR